MFFYSVGIKLSTAFFARGKVRCLFQYFWFWSIILLISFVFSFLKLFIRPFTTFHVYCKTIWQECPTTKFTSFKHVIIPVRESFLIIGMHVFSGLSSSQHFIKVFWWLRYRFSHIPRKFILLDFPFLYARFNMNFKTFGAVFSSTNITD